jgi:hypothetical protein
MNLPSRSEMRHENGRRSGQLVAGKLSDGLVERIPLPDFWRREGLTPDLPSSAGDFAGSMSRHPASEAGVEGRQPDLPRPRTGSSNPSPSSKESGANLHCLDERFRAPRPGIGRVEREWDQRFESSFLQRRVVCEPEDDINILVPRATRARIKGGIVKPSAFAVLRLMTSSNLVGCWTGRSAGFAPFRILST